MRRTRFAAPLAVSVALIALFGSAVFADDATPYQLIKKDDVALGEDAGQALAYKYKAMSADPFVFYRGTARLFFRDMANGWALDKLTSPKTTVWLSGDMHLANAGVIELSDKSLAYDLNDFDEAARGPYILDVQRLAASVELAGGDADDVAEMAQTYHDAMEAIAKGKLDSSFKWTDKNARGLIKDALDQAGKKSRKDQLKKLTKDGAFKATDEVVPLTGAERAKVIASIPEYVRSLPASERQDADYYKVLDVARKLESGTGSEGLDRYWVLLRGKSDDPDDAHVIEIKGERPSALAAYDPKLGADGFKGPADRVDAGERALLGDPDRFLGKTTIDGKPFLVRERAPSKVSVDLTAKMSDKDLRHLADDTAYALAVAHASSTKDPTATAQAILAASGDGKTFAAALSDFADKYTAKVKTDWKSFVTEAKEDEGAPAETPSVGIDGALDQHVNAGREKTGGR